MDVRSLTSRLDAQRGHAFLPPDDELAGVPALYRTEGTPPDRTVLHLHYFVASCDWWIAEFDPAEGLAFGYACLGNPRDAEWGYVSLIELADIEVNVPVQARVRTDDQRHPTRLATVGTLPSVVERDLYWTPKPFAEVEAELARRWGR